jgi:hypothetical protein
MGIERKRAWNGRVMAECVAEWLRPLERIVVTIETISAQNNLASFPWRLVDATQVGRSYEIFAVLNEGTDFPICGVKLDCGKKLM